MKILIIDDDPDLHLIAGALLRRAGHELIAAETGAAGVAAARDHQPDLVLLDVQLAETTGPEVRQQLRADARTADIPVAFLTGTTDPAELAALARRGVRGLIGKPVAPATFAADVAALVTPRD